MRTRSPTEFTICTYIERKITFARILHYDFLVLIISNAYREINCRFTAHMNCIMQQLTYTEKASNVNTSIYGKAKYIENIQVGTLNNVVILANQLSIKSNYFIKCHFQQN